MKINRKMMIVLIILTISIATITAINAKENTTDTNQTNTLIKDTNTKPDIIKQTTKNIKTDTTSVTSYQELYQTIEEAKQTSSSQVITLEEGDYNITQPIEIKGKTGPITITINGQNNIINGQLLKNFITVTKSNTLIINNLTIENTNSTAGSAIYSKGIVNITNITFKNSHSESWISNCGGAIYNSGNMTINNSTFINNTIITDTFGGGAIFNNGILTVNNSNFQENNAQKGSAIFTLKSKTIIENSNFTNNHANNTATIYNFNSTLNISNCIFNNNTALNSSLLESIDKAVTLIKESTVINHSQSNTLIKNQANTTISNCNINNNSILLNLIENNDEITIHNSNITENNASNIIDNTAILTIKENNISDNNATEYIIKDDEKYTDITSIINTTTFNSNRAQSILYNINSTIYVSDSIFINNTSDELFHGSTDTFKIVSNNIYIGNNMSTMIESDDNISLNYDKNIEFTAYIKTLPIYNTTIETGTVLVYDTDENIGIFDIDNSKSSIILENNITDEKIYTLIYTDKVNYKNTSKDIHIKSLRPEYEIKIIASSNNVSYNDSYNYTIYVKNIGLGNSSNVTIQNNIPSDVEIISTDSDNYDTTTNTWLIEQLDSMDEYSLNLSVRIKTCDDFNISIEIPSDNNIDNITVNRPVEILKPEINLDFEYDTVSPMLHEGYNLILNLNNTSGGRSANTIIYIIDDEDNVEIIESGILEGYSSKSFVINKTANHIGENILKVIAVECLTNTTREYNITILVGNVSIQVDNLTSYHNDTVNLTATILNSSNITDKCIAVFKINGLTVKEHDISIKDNQITLENFVIPDNWSKENYLLEVKVLDQGFNNIIHNTGMIKIVKRSIISKIEHIEAMPGDVVEFTAYLYDNDGNSVNNGFVKFKINGCTIDKQVSVNNSLASLLYRIPDTYRGSNYTISLVYGENKYYYSNRNYSILTLKPQECEVHITNSTYKRGNDFYINATIHGKKNGLAAYSGKAVFKLNDKTFTDIIYVNGSFVNCTIINLNIKNINKITLCYSGNNVLESTRKSINF